MKKNKNKKFIDPRYFMDEKEKSPLKEELKNDQSPIEETPRVSHSRGPDYQRLPPDLVKRVAESLATLSQNMERLANNELVLADASDQLRARWTRELEGMIHNLAPIEPGQKLPDSYGGGGSLEEGIKK